MTSIWQQDLDRAIHDRYGRMVKVRRHLHADPELSGQEHKTSLYLYQLLGEEGFAVSMGPDGRGVIADHTSAADEQGAGRLALRADIDALRIHDQKQAGYRSATPGVMHACGHDAHTAIVWGALTALKDLDIAGRLPWPLRLRGIFQPAEETSTGAKEMIDAGVLKKVTGILAVHVDPTRQVGHIGLREGVLTANCDAMRIRITGQGGHAARPHEASDPIAAAAHLINALYLFIPRATDSLDAVVVTVGQILGGDNPNVIPEHVELYGTLRTLDQQVRKNTIQHIRRLSHGIGQSSDTKIDVQFELGTQGVRNNGAMIELLRRATLEVVGEDGIDNIPRPSMGSEDFAFYLDHVPGTMFRLGCASSAADTPLLHTPLFDVEEEALRIGAKVLARAAVFWSDPRRE